MLLEAKNIRKSFDGQDVLKGVDLQVDKGDVVAILGPSGSGKTTLLRCINFLERADGGTLTLDGETFDLPGIGKKDVARLRKKTAFVFQNYNLFRNRTALQNVTEGLIVGRRMPRARAVALGEQALQKVGLLDRRDAYPSQLSGGQQQRVSVGRALITRPALLLADEPTGNLDTKNSAAILALLQQFHRQLGQTLLLITHDPAIARQADRVLSLRDGRLEKDEVMRP